MLTLTTLNTIACLRVQAGYSNRFEGSPVAPPGINAEIEPLLIANGILNNLGVLSRPLHTISLLDLLLAINEGVYPVHLCKEEDEIYAKYRVCAQSLGVVNHMLHVLLSKIKLTDL